jgi:PAS domain S-box-containing protein
MVSMRFVNWPLRAKVAALLVAASLVSPQARASRHDATLATAPAVFTMAPEAAAAAQVAQETRSRILLAAAVIAAAGLAGLALAVSILKPLRKRRAEEALRASEERARMAAIIESSDDAIVGKTLNGVITSWNPGAARLFGYSADEAIGHSIQMLIPPERLDEEPLILARIARGEKVEHFETVRVRKDGTHIDVSATISPIRGAQGQIVGASKIARDITERKSGQARLQAQLDRMNLLDQITRAIGERQDLQSIYQVAVRSVEERLPVDFSCVCRYDPVADALAVIRVGVRSEALAMALGMGPESHIPIDRNGLSRCVQGELVHEPDMAAVPFPFAQRLVEGGLRSLVLAPLQSESRVFGILVAARVLPESFSSGDCEFLRQLSAHVALAAQQAELHGALQRAYEDLRQSQQTAMQQERLRALGQMASGIAHDINNAISPAALYTESLLEREPQLSERGRGYLVTIARAIDDVATTVARMREFYRQREPQMLLVPVQLNALVQQVIDLTRARWSDMPQQRGAVVDLQTDLAPDLPAVRGIESEVREALINLVFNAVDAMPDGGTLTLRTHRSGPAGEGGEAMAPAAIVAVSDTGVGMDDDTRRRCLEPFFTTKGERGTGLGLAMVYGVAQRHGADVAIDSVVGRGTTVSLWFPIPATPLSVGEVRRPQAPVSRLRILIVDDDPLLLKSLCDTLELDGHAVVAANGGQAGIEAFQANPAAFDLVVTDLGMPNVDGRKVASAVKQVDAAMPVIMLTGWGQRLVADGDVPEHIDRVLSKPPKLRELRAALAELSGTPLGKARGVSPRET